MRRGALSSPGLVVQVGLAVGLLAALGERPAAARDSGPGGLEDPPVQQACIVAHTKAEALGVPSSLIREYPGVQCVMNVGLLYPGDYHVKVPDCDGLTSRRDFLSSGGYDCDTISIIELLSDQQCRCACGQYQDPAEAQYCVQNGWVPDPDRCVACGGCGSGSGGASCENQARVICPEDEYEVSCQEGNPNVLPPIGCDCTCYRKGECSLTGGGCHAEQFRPFDLRCTPNNSASCVFCDNAPDGPSIATCTMHPDHCGNGSWEELGFDSLEDCFYSCNTALVERVVHAIQGYDIKTLAGDWNCSATADCALLGDIGDIPGVPDLADIIDLVDLFNPLPIRCPYLEDLEAAGLRVCEHAPYINPVCSLDFVVSNWCGCGMSTAPFHQFGFRNGHLNDHPIAVFGTHRAYQLYDMPIVEAHSQKNCGGAVSQSPTSDSLGAGCDLVGWYPSWCEGEGSTSRGLLMYKRPNECPLLYEMFGYPRVLACDRADAMAMATCTPIDQASTSVRQKTGDAEVSAAASCSGGCPEIDWPEPDVAAGQDRALPLLVDGEESLVVSRVWSREYGPTRCTNSWPPFCPTPEWQGPVCPEDEGGGGSGGGGGPFPGGD